MFLFNDSLLFQELRKEQVASSGSSVAACLALGSSSASFPGSTVVFHSASPVLTRSLTLAPIARELWEDTTEDSKTSKTLELKILRLLLYFKVLALLCVYFNVKFLLLLRNINSLPLHYQCFKLSQGRVRSS